MVMGVITGIGGGLIRDLLTGLPTLLVSRDLYATPILLGMAVQLLVIKTAWLDASGALLVGVACIFSGRALAVAFHLQMPAFLGFNTRD
jgi:uncharacterized membrane protein YeiH